MVLRRLPRLGQIVIQPDLVDRADGGFSVGVCGQQHLARVRKYFESLLQKLYAVHQWHALVSDE